MQCNLASLFVVCWFFSKLLFKKKKKKIEIPYSWAWYGGGGGGGYYQTTPVGKDLKFIPSIPIIVYSRYNSMRKVYSLLYPNMHNCISRRLIINA